MRHLARRPRGGILIVVLLVMSVLAAITASVVKISSSTIKMTGTTQDIEAAFRAAEAGSKAGFLEYRNDTGWDGFSPQLQTLPGGESTFQVQVFEHGETPGPDHGVIVPDGLVYLQSTGRTRSGRVCTVGLMIKPDGGAQDFAAVVNGSVELTNGAQVESRDPATDLPLTAAASVVTNSVGAASIKLDNGAVVKGMARPGPGAGSGAVSVANGAQATLGYSPLVSTIPLDPVVLPHGAPGLRRDVVIDGSTMTVGNAPLPPGTPLPPAVTYGKLEIKNGGTLQLVTGKYLFEEIVIDNGTIKNGVSETVEFYSAGNVEIKNGALINDSKNPSRMKFSVKAGTVKLDLSGGGAAYYILNAPDSDVELINGSRQYGALVADNLKVDGSFLYYDPASGGAVEAGGSTAPLIKAFYRF